MGIVTQVADISYETVTIPSGQTTSNAIGLSGRTLCGIITPSALDGSAFTFTASSSLGGTYVAVQDGLGNSISRAVSTSKYVKCDPADFAGINFLKVVGSSQSADRTITLALRGV